MDKGLENIDDLIAKFLSGEAGKEESNQLEAWMESDPENRVYFEDAKKMFAQIDNFKIAHRVNTVKAWEKLNERISSETEAQEESKIIPLFRRSSFFRSAASLLLITALALLVNYFLGNSSPDPTVLTATSQVLDKKLPDGSTVTINKNSEIAYVMHDKVREVKLKGEAFFEVVHNEEAPFEIMIDDIIIKDIGTSFNVKAFPESNTIEVLVESGEVYFYSTSQKGVNLVKGEKATYNKTTKQFVKLTPSPTENIASYKSKVFYFKGNILREVVNQVNEVYGSSIVLGDPRLGNCRLSTMFHDAPLDTIVEIISETLDLKIERKGEKIILNGTPCAE
ncbi:FecR family protein [Aurantibacillus circumpalustris]|uniref:FecR family protein n=1 Tax=Aurantibacillus circumpalustris TaxID=3036359 RepID=UPI00295A87E1|nr:FecR domain-containing protein [Aurantibacillus circumpalustris]